MLLVVLICFDDHGSDIEWCGAPCPMRHAQGFPWCLWTPLLGECLRRIATAAAMVIDVACGPMAYKTQIFAYHFVENQLLIFAIEWNRVTRMISTKNVQYSMWRPIRCWDSLILNRVCSTIYLVWAKRRGLNWMSYLLVGQGRSSAHKFSFLKILIPPSYQPPPLSILTSPSCSPPPI